jgi:SAM-dependent methyltransferase
MEKIFQNEWHGIYFKNLTTVSASRLADTELYKIFYRHLLAKYQDWSKLDPEWVKLKLQTAEFLKSKFSDQKNIKILSIGCGLGMVEKALLDYGYNNIDITEVSEEPLKWIKKYITGRNIFIGNFSDFVPSSRDYDIIYLAGIEYCLNQEELIFLLKKAGSILSKDGRCILISWSFEPFSITGIVSALVKNNIRFLLELLRIKERGQFWGYSRNRSEFFEAMRSAGFDSIKDGVFSKKTRWDTYWIEGRI